MEFAPSLDIVINETLPALQKVPNYNLYSWSGNNFIWNALSSPTSMQKKSYYADEETSLIIAIIRANFSLDQAVLIQ